jgi:hypothetical protein
VNRPELQRAKAGFEQVRAILHDEWDPIGSGAPEDEYDSYAWPVLALLLRGAPRSEIEDYLRRAADEAMQCPVPEARLALVLDHLMALVL